jgi:chromosomal replication initiation ATPase DnaA
MQTTLPLMTSDLYNIDDFIVSSSNQEAYNKIVNWSFSWGVSPYPFALLLYGASGSGKSFLTKIWQNLTGACVLNGFAGQKSLEILNNYKAFVIEDIEGLQADYILHYFNFFHEEKKYVLFTTCNLVNNFSLADLDSRIASLLRIQIYNPDDDLLRMFVFKHLSSHSLTVSEAVLNFLLLHLPRRFDKIVEILDKINESSLVYKRALTVPFVKAILQKFNTQ